jgi:Fe-S-cluster-containing hydrogenase component 2
LDEDPNDPLRDGPVAAVREEQKNKLKYACDPCKPLSISPPLPCVNACPSGAISHFL